MHSINISGMIINNMIKKYYNLIPYTEKCSVIFFVYSEKHHVINKEINIHKS